MIFFRTYIYRDIIIIQHEEENKIIMDWQGGKAEFGMGDPEIVYMQFYLYNNGKSELMFVPALRFPIVETPVNAPFYKENIIVPLVPDMVENLLARGASLPMPEPILPSAVPGAEQGIMPETTVISPQ